MTKACLIAVIISLLFSMQARAAHFCLEQGGSDIPKASQAMGVESGSAAKHGSSGAMDERGSDSHGTGHCDLCSHASFSAVGPHIPAVIAPGELAQRIAAAPSRSPLNPALRRPDKPPR